MNTLSYTLSGCPIELHIRKTAKKNIILRPRDNRSLILSIPPWLRRTELLSWLCANENLLHRVLAQAPAVLTERQPESIWYGGRALRLHTNARSGHIVFTADTVSLPAQSWEANRALLRHRLFQAASETLLPLLECWTQHTGHIPAAAALTDAKSFWGVCRAQTGIRLNWRLIGAPSFVQDYVCIHELCHLPHPNHSPRFWAEVARHTPHTGRAKSWLKTHGAELFACG